MHFDVVTLFPDMLDALLKHGITQRAYAQKRFSLRAWNPRAYTDDAYHRVDDRPYGGGPGMVMLAEPLVRTLDAVAEDAKASGRPAGRVVYLSPQGAPLSHSTVLRLGNESSLVLLAGRYEGVDERFLSKRGSIHR